MISSLLIDNLFINFSQALMGVFFYVRSVALIEDIAVPEEATKVVDKFLLAIDDGYYSVSFSLMIT